MTAPSFKFWVQMTDILVRLGESSALVQLVKVSAKEICYLKNLSAVKIFYVLIIVLIMKV